MFLFKTDLQNHECDDKSDDQGHDKTSRRHFHIGDVTGFARSGLRVYLQQFHAKADPLHAIPTDYARLLRVRAPFFYENKSCTDASENFSQSP